MDDWQLIQEYVERKSDSAFRVLVERYTNLVYSAALRQSSEPHLAEEIAQTVFILLAQKADGFRRDVILPGWLFRTTHFVAKRAVRTEKRRQRRDMEALQMQELEMSDAVWLRVAPHLDEALAELGEIERNAVILRYFQGKELRQVGVALGMSEEAARKRVARSVDKLRSFFAKRGYSISASLLVTALGTQTVKAAPAGLASTFAATALSTGVAAGAFPLVLQVLSAWRWAKIKVLGLGAVGGIALVALLIPFLSEPRSSIDSDQPGVAITGEVIAAPSSEQNLIEPVPEQIPTTLINDQSGLRFRVVARDSGEPVGNAKLLVRKWNDPSIETDTSLVTDSAGFCNISHSQTTRLDVGVFTSGWEARHVTWIPGRNDPIPAEYTLRVERLTKAVGGFLVDANGSPVPNADVMIEFLALGDSTGRESDKERVGCPFTYAIGKSDGKGRWTGMVIPTEHKGYIIRATHPHFAETWIASSPASDIPWKESLKETLDPLWAGTLVTKMNSSFRLSGRVVDEAGNPIAGARISEAIQMPVYTTDRDGWFEVHNLERGLWFFTVAAENFSPSRQKADLKQQMEPLEIQLAAGAVLRLKTVDENGTPVAGATVSLEQWGEDRHVLDWQAKSDSEGRIEWRSAPPNATLELCARKDDYCYSRDLKFEADGDEHLIKMQRSLSVTVRAIDEATGKLIREFKAYPGYGKDKYAWNRGSTVYSKDGTLSIRFEETRIPWRVRVDAKGYVSGTSKSLPQDFSGILEIALKPSAESYLVRGTIFQPDGEVAVGADVALCTIEQPMGVVLVQNGLREADLSLLRKVDSNGYFEFEANPAAHTVIAAHPSGFARVRLHKGKDPLQIVLQPWGRIEGVVRISLPPDMHVVLSDWAAAQYDGGLHLEPREFRASVGSDGRFVIESAPPGEFYLSIRELPSAHRTRVSVKAGETVSAEIGSYGSDVIGRLVTADKGLVTDWEKQVTSAQLLPKSVSPSPKPKGLTGDAAKFWEVDFSHSEAGYSRLLETQNIPLFIQPDGTFRGYNVLPGSYRLSIPARKIDDQSKTIAHHSENIVIAQPPAGVTEIDLGERILIRYEERKR